MIRTLTIVLVCFCFGVQASAVCEERWTRKVKHSDFEGDVPNVAADIARTFGIPVLFEVPFLDAKVKIPAGEHRAEEVLQTLAAKVKDSRFHRSGCVGHFADVHLTNAAGNLLNVRFEKFRLPANVAELQLALAPNLIAKHKGLTGTAISGVPGLTLADKPLPRLQLTRQSGREILLKALGEQPSFFTIIVFPSPRATTEKDFLLATSNWFWRATESDDHLYVQPPPKRKTKH